MYLGIEIGGTKLQLGVGPGDGTLTALWRGSVDVPRGGDGIREQILKETPGLLERAGLARQQIHGIGVGFGGPVDDADQTVIKSHQIAGWDGFPLAKWLTELLGWPVALANDADVAGLAEALFGAGKGLSPIFYITIGSGIGGGLIINGEIYRGCGRGAAEIGHLRSPFLNNNKIVFSSVEAIASGWGIAGNAEFLADSTPAWHRSSLARKHRKEQAITALTVVEAAKCGDEIATRVLTQAWAALAEGICHVIALLAPKRIVIGGGVSLMGDQVLFAPLREMVAERVFQPFA
ncbi:MAG TPA: ROK family protein, partial [Gemmataceae bacterium]|nr:ROK family protein [Gemmataceae bacterium]